MYTSMDELQQAIAGVLRLDGNTPSITNEQRLRETSIDQFVFTAVFATAPEVNPDFSVLERAGRIARDRYHLGGVVQHGASTLPVEVFDQFPRHHTLEIYLATGFQNIIYDQMPAELRQRIYQWVEQQLHHEWKEGWNREQFIYSSRKKAFGPFKQELWQLSELEKQPIREHLEQQFRIIFERLNVVNTQEALAPFCLITRPPSLPPLCAPLKSREP